MSNNGTMKGLGAVGAVVTIALCIAGGSYNGFVNNFNTPTQTTSTATSTTAVKTSTDSTTAINDSKSFTIVDSTGQKVTFDKIPSKIVVLDPNAYNLIKLLGGESKVVGVSKMMSTTSGEHPTGAKVVGNWNDPDVNEILTLKADVVFCYPNTNKSAIKELEAAGVKVVYINGDEIGSLTSDVTAMGEILGEQAKASQFNAIATKYIDLVKTKLANVQENQRKTVYFEGVNNNQTAGSGSAIQELLSAAGVKNVAGNLGTSTMVNNSWILSKNPDMIIKAEPNSILGDSVTNADVIKSTYDQLIKREGWSNLKAVKDGQVYLMNSNLESSDVNSIVAMLYIAKWAYPTEFTDINPAQVQQQINTEFLGTSAAGTYVYSATK